MYTLRSRMQWGRVAIAALALVVLSACSQHLPPTVSPEGKAAVYSQQVIGIADGALTVLDQLTETRLALASSEDQKTQIRAQTRKAAAVLAQVGESGRQLGTALAAVHDARLAAKDATGDVAKVRAILAALVKLMPLVTEPIDDPAIRAGVNGALGTIASVFLNITAELPPAPAAAG